MECILRNKYGYDNTKKKKEVGRGKAVIKILGKQNNMYTDFEVWNSITYSRNCQQCCRAGGVEKIDMENNFLKMLKDFGTIVNELR